MVVAAATAHSSHQIAKVAVGEVALPRNRPCPYPSAARGRCPEKSVTVRAQVRLPAAAVSWCQGLAALAGSWLRYRDA
jgi:hypothetical protein